MGDTNPEYLPLQIYTFSFSSLFNSLCLSGIKARAFFLKWFKKDNSRAADLSSYLPKLHDQIHEAAGGGLCLLGRAHRRLQ